MLDIRVELPRSARLRLARLVDGRAIAWAESQAINRTARNVTTLGIKEVAKEMGIKRSKLAKRGRQRNFRDSSKYGGINPKRRATRRRLFTEISARGRPFNVRRFGAKRVLGGVHHEAWGRGQTARGAWMLKNGAAVIRSGSSFRSVFGPGVTHVFQYPRIARLMQREAVRKFPGHFSTAVRYALSSQFHGRR